MELEPLPIDEVIKQGAYREEGFNKHDKNLWAIVHWMEREPNTRSKLE